jgi:hypothetical protein
VKIIMGSHLTNAAKLSDDGATSHGLGTKSPRFLAPVAYVTMPYFGLPVMDDRPLGLGRGACLCRSDSLWNRFSQDRARPAIHGIKPALKKQDRTGQDRTGQDRTVHA